MNIDKDLASVQEMRDAVQKANEAQEQFMNFSQEKIDYIVEAVAQAAYRKSKELAQMAVEETGMGVAEHKVLKNEVGSMGVFESIKDEKTIGVLENDTKNKIQKIAYPFGVIAAIIPTTNPTSTAMNKSLISLKSGNGIVVSPHPRAKKCTVETLKVCSKAATDAGAPEGLIGWISVPSMEATTQLMHHKDIDLILSTGGGGLVKAAYSSGKPAYGVGPGNVPVYIEETANIQEAVQKIVDSKTFDNGTICATEQAVVVDKSVKEEAIREFERNGTYFLNAQEKQKIGNIISNGNGQVNPAIVGKSAVTIAEMGGISVPANTRLLIAEENQFGKDIPFSIEILGPAFGMFTADNKGHAKEISINLLNLGGRGHTFSIHSNDNSVIEEFGQAMPVSRVTVNTLSSIGAVGSTTNLDPSMTLGCGGYGGNISSDNITARHLFNIKRIAYPTKDVEVPKAGENNSVVSSTNNNVDNIVSNVFNATQDEGNGQIDTKKIETLVKQVLKEYQNQ